MDFEANITFVIAFGLIAETARQADARSAGRPKATRHYVGATSN